jgi:Na+-translocating ferredoxin:NAD+ oxidoreductase RnfC subunit
MSTPITKSTAGLIVLPLDHQLIKRRLLPAVAVKRIGASACDQCFRCTELCPRWLLGYNIVPHEVMRSLLFGPGEKREYHNEKAMLCIECNICSLYACPEDLDPKSICSMGKEEMFTAGFRVNKSREVKANPVRSGRQVPTKMLTRKLDLTKYDNLAPYTRIDWSPSVVRIPLKQHSGVPAIANVANGQRVTKGEMIGRIGDQALGAHVHSSIDGVVDGVGNSIVIRKA